MTEDAIESVRGDCARSAERQLLAHEAHVTKLAELDEKLFALDKEVLKLKLALPASVAARISIGSQSLQLMPGQQANPAGVAVDQKLDELSGELETMYGLGQPPRRDLTELKWARGLMDSKADAAANRSADRQQFEALTNRLREAARSSQRFEKDVETQLVDMETRVKQVRPRAFHCNPLHSANANHSRRRRW